MLQCVCAESTGTIFFFYSNVCSDGEWVIGVYLHALERASHGELSISQSSHAGSRGAGACPS